MNKKTENVDAFFYGLFMDESLLRAKGLDPQNGRIAFLENFCLIIGARATLVPCPNGRVYGMLYSLTHNELESLYSEESVSAYRSEDVVAQFDDGSSTPAVCYNLPTQSETAEQNPEYVSRLKQLANKIGLPESYVSSIE